MNVLKFGGTSVGSPEAIRKTMAIVRERGAKIAVVSAFTGVTDALIKVARTAATNDVTWRSQYDDLKKRHDAAVGELVGGSLRPGVQGLVDGVFSELESMLVGISLLRELSPRTLDVVMSAGERLSSTIIAAAFVTGGDPAVAHDTRTSIFATAEFGNARVLHDRTERSLRAVFGNLGPESPIHVVTGFIASTDRGETVTLGRGGSDFTAAVIGAAIDAGEVEIWTDVDGILTADPRKVKSAFSLPSLSYEEAMELSHFGAKVLYPPTVQPALAKGIPIRILNTFKPEFPGTIIADGVPSSPYPIRGIASISSVSLVRVEGPGMVGVCGIAGRLFASLAAKKVSVILITQASSEHSICFAVAPDAVETAKEAIEAEFSREIAEGRIYAPVIENGMSVIAVVGDQMAHTHGILGKVYRSLGLNGINVVAVAQGSSELNISTVIERKDEAKAMNAIHDAFFLSGGKSVNVFMIGVGLIGKTLLDQVRTHKDSLQAERNVKINLIGLANSRKMAVNTDGIDPGEWREALEAGEKADLAAFAEIALKANLPNTVVVDCTASDEVPDFYARFLDASIPVVTPNKRAGSGNYTRYSRIKAISKSGGAPFLCEATVGAGLPVISTLNDLIVSGDRIDRIEGVLSGTISYILNNFRAGEKFSSLVRRAKDMGLTEPDPRDDLSAMDAARKALIIAREFGSKKELKDVKVEPILSERCLRAATTEEFFAALETHDHEFEAKRAAAEANGKALRYVASVDSDEIKLGWKEVGPEDPFFMLKDAENAIAYTTERYATIPLVVRGPGAGADVTAGGVFADVLRNARALW